MSKTLKRGRGRGRAKGRKGGTRKKPGKKILIIEESSSPELKMSSLDTEPQSSETKSSTFLSQKFSCGQNLQDTHFPSLLGRLIGLQRLICL